jgi:hypothetical protein
VRIPFVHYTFQDNLDRVQSGDKSGRTSFHIIPPKKTSLSIAMETLFFCIAPFGEVQSGDLSGQTFQFVLPSTISRNIAVETRDVVLEHYPVANNN